MKTTAVSMVAWCGFLFFASGVTQAQPIGIQPNSGGEKGIKTQGDAVLELKAELMRMSVDLRVSGIDMRDALKKLKTRKAEVEKELQKLGALKESIKFADPEIEQGQPQSYNVGWARMPMAAQVQVMPDNAGVAKLSKLKSTVTADWSLPKGDTPELLVAVQKIQYAVKEADFGGRQESSDESADQEMNAEALGTPNVYVPQPVYGGMNTTNPGDPSFLFVAKVSAEDRAKTFADAFRAAKSNAVELAKAIDVELGAVRSVTNTVSAYSSMSPVHHYYQGPSQAVFLLPKELGNTPLEEAGDLKPTEIKYSVTVIVTFDVKSNQ